IRPGASARLEALLLDPSRPGARSTTLWLGCDPDPFAAGRGACSDLDALSSGSLVDTSMLPAGVRMLGLVALGSALATLTAIGFDVVGKVPVDAISRVVQGVLAGVGFLGAGVIMRDETGQVHRLNTAASVWVTATLGVACGLGAWIPTFITAVLVLVLLSVGRIIDHRFYGKFESDKDKGA
ncbi:MAG: MgtC/SapB family protein, partial [Micropepsaceae bacterium]